MTHETRRTDAAVHVIVCDHCGATAEMPLTHVLAPPWCYYVADHARHDFCSVDHLRVYLMALNAATRDQPL